MKRILCFTDNLGAGGAQRQLVGLTRMLKVAGYNVEVCTYQDNNFFKENIESNGIHCTQIGNEHTPKLKLFRMLFNHFKQSNPDVVIAYLERPCMIASAFRMMGLNYKLIVSERNTNTSYTKQDWLRFQMFRIADYVVPNSHSQAKFINEHCSYLKKKTVAITNFCSFLEQSVSDRTRKIVPEIVVAASIWPPKNTVGFIEATKILKQKGIKFHVSWYGLVDESDYYLHCKALINEYALEEYVDLLPKTKQLVQKYKEADYFCLPSFYEGTPNVLCEAICMSLPVICSNVCDNPIYAQEGINGFLFDPKSSVDIAEKILSALQLNEAQYMNYCSSSRSIAEDKLSEDKFIKQYIQLIQLYG